MNIMEFSARLNIGGAQAVAANISKYADSSYHFCYVVFGNEIGEYEEDILRNGHRIVHIPKPRGNMISFMKRIVRLMREERSDVVHAHTMFNCGVIMFAAWLARVPGRISHSHTTNDNSQNTVFRRLYQSAMRALIHIFATDWLACGVEAGNMLYGKEWFQKRGVVIRNGIDVEKYRFHSDVRQRVRLELGLQDAYIIGHVGHYETVKNQSFLISLMPEILKVNPNVVLLLYGDGSDRQRLAEEIEHYGLNNTVRLMGNVNNIYEILSAMDVFVFPSLYEGTPIALIEAQTNGLPCLISDTVPNDACITDCVEKLSLELPAQRWVEKILSAKRNDASVAAAQVARKYGTINSSMEPLYKIFSRYDRKQGTQ